jgi:outer membrane immunogenic protein
MAAITRAVRLAAMAAIAVLVVTPVAAADLALKAPPPPPPYSWNGFYVGGNLGGVLETASGTSDFLDSAPIPAALFSATNPQNNRLNPSSVIGGGQIGYNWQFNQRWLAGIEGDWDFTNANYSFCRQTNTASIACFNPPIGDGFENIASTTRWLATLRGRLGVTAGNWLFYGTGGVAEGQVATTLTQNCPTGCGSSATALLASGSSTATRTGWVAGLGGEVAFWGNWSTRIEWLHIDLGNIGSSFTTNGSSTPVLAAVPSTQTTVWSRSERYDVFRVGLNYRFWGLGGL